MTHPNQAPSPSDIRQEDVIPLSDLSLFWRGRAQERRILDNSRDKSVDATLREADAYETCAEELRAALSAQTGEPVAWRYNPEQFAEFICNEFEGEECAFFEFEESIKEQWRKLARTILADLASQRPQPDTAPSYTPVGEGDICIDCDGRGIYPSKALCVSCGGTGAVCAGDGISRDTAPSPLSTGEVRDDNAAFKNTDDGSADLVLAAVRHCANSWDGNARLLGNVRASDISRACDIALAALSAQTGEPDFDGWPIEALDEIERMRAAIERGEYTELPPLGDSRRRAKTPQPDTALGAGGREALERAAKVADEFAAYEQTVLDRAYKDHALSETGRKSIVSAAGSRQVAAEQIAHDIRALSSQPDTAPSPLSTGEVLRKALKFYDDLDRPHAPGEAKLLDEMAAALSAQTSEPDNFKAGDRVHHIGRDDDGTVLSFPEPGVVRVEFDNPTPRGNRSIGEFDATWFKTHPGWLKLIPQKGEEQ